MNEELWRNLNWQPPEGVKAVVSTRLGGVSEGRYSSLNLSHAVGDDDGAVGENRLRFAASLSSVNSLCWLTQVHGTQVITAHESACGDDASNPTADAVWTDKPGFGCVVTVADCVPVLLASDDGKRVAAVHAGWRGLAEGVVAAAAECFERGCFSAYVGPCIGFENYQVGVEVVDALARLTDDQSLFKPDQNASGKFFADLAGVAKSQLIKLGASSVSCANEDTYACSDYYSARRDGAKSGRFAAAIWIVDPEAC